MKCNNCGNEMRENASFCTNCGYSVRPNITENVVPAGPVTAVTATDKKNNTGLVIIILVLIAVLTICGVLIGVMFTQLNGSEDDAENVVYVSENEESNKPVPKPNTQKIQEEDITPEPDTEYSYYDGFLFPSDREYITKSDLDLMTRSQVALVRNEIYARHGYIFQTEPYKTYFESKDWYVANKYFDESMFNSVEKRNKEYIVQYEESKGWR